MHPNPSPADPEFYWYHFGPPPDAGSGQYEADVAQAAFENFAFPIPSVEEATAGIWYEYAPAYDPNSNSGFGGYGEIGYGGLGGMGGYGSWGSFGGWGHGL